MNNMCFFFLSLLHTDTVPQYCKITAFWSVHLCKMTQYKELWIPFVSKTSERRKGEIPWDQVLKFTIAEPESQSLLALIFFNLQMEGNLPRQTLSSPCLLIKVMRSQSCDSLSPFPDNLAAVWVCVYVFVYACTWTLVFMCFQGWGWLLMWECLVAKILPFYFSDIVRCRLSPGAFLVNASYGCPSDHCRGLLGRTSFTALCSLRCS